MAAVMLPPTHGMDPRVHIPLSQPQLQMPQFHPLTGAGGVPSPFRPTVPQVRFIPPHMAAPSNPALVHQMPPHMLQAVGPHHMAPQMAATGVPAGIYPGFPPAMIGGPQMMPTMPSPTAFSGPQVRKRVPSLLKTASPVDQTNTECLLRASSTHCKRYRTSRVISR